MGNCNQVIVRDQFVLSPSLDLREELRKSIRRVAVRRTVLMCFERFEIEI